MINAAKSMAPLMDVIKGFKFGKGKSAKKRGYANQLRATYYDNEDRDMGDDDRFRGMRSHQMRARYYGNDYRRERRAAARYGDEHDRDSDSMYERGDRYSDSMYARGDRRGHARERRARFYGDEGRRREHYGRREDGRFEGENEGMHTVKATVVPDDGDEAEYYEPEQGPSDFPA